jgi:hypothetical protein
MASVATILAEEGFIDVHVVAMPGKELALVALISIVREEDRNSTYYVVNDVGISRVGHPTVKCLKITIAASGGSQAGLGWFFHQTLNSVKEVSLLSL